MADLNVEQYQAMGEMVNQYGFLIVFGVVMLLIVALVMYTLIHKWSKNIEARSNSEAERAKVELSLMEKQQLAQMDQQNKLFDMVTSVQTDQIAQMHEISDVIRIMKDELLNNTRYVMETNVHFNTLNTSVADIVSRYQLTYDSITKLESDFNNITKQSNEKTDDIMESLDEVKKLLTQLCLELQEKK